jgi:hypothetical protein
MTNGHDLDRLNNGLARIPHDLKEGEHNRENCDLDHSTYGQGPKNLRKVFNCQQRL